MLETLFFLELKTKLLKQALEIIALKQNMIKTFLRTRSHPLFTPMTWRCSQVILNKNRLTSHRFVVILNFKSMTSVNM